MFEVNQRRCNNALGLRSAVLLSVLAAGLGCTLPSTAQAQEDPERAMLDLDPGNFASSTTINHNFWPLRPGTQFVYEGVTMEDGVRTPHRIETTVTDLSKDIGGVRALIIHELDYVEDQLEEAELAFYAQDDDGNVWHLGEYTEVFSEIDYVGGRIWMVGYPEGARAGIMIPAEPQADTPSYSEGFAPPPYNWSDRGRVAQTDEQTTVAAGSYEGVVVIEEFNNEEPGAVQLKYYAPGVGVVRIGWSGEDALQEEMELIEHNQLDAGALEAIRRHALEMEARGYSYGLTPPLEQLAAQ